MDNAAGSYTYVNADGMSLNLINDTHNYRDTRDNPYSDPVPLQPLQAIFWNVRGNLFFGQFDDQFDVVVYGKPGAHQEYTDIDALGKVYKFCNGSYDFSNPNISIKFDNSVAKFNEACAKEKDCFISQGVNFSCMNSSLLNPAQDLVLLDGSDFFDIAADRYRCFDVPKIQCTFNYVIPVM